MSLRPALLLALQCSIVAVAGAACGGPAADTCVHDDDCASHFCKADGTCAAGTTDGGSALPDGPAGSGAPDAPAGACTPNHDGTISASEVPLVAGRSANFRVATDATIDTAGTSGSDGTRAWDLSGMLSGDQTDAIALLSPAGAWWHSDFPDATYATPLAAGSDVLGIFEVTDSGVALLGVASPASGGPTELAYDPPAEILHLPFGNGDTWTSSSHVTGTLAGVPSNYTENYSSRVDAVGTMTTPYGAFPVLRVATDLTDLQITTPFNSSRTFAWVAECYGTVAKITSQQFESGEEFTDAAEVDRLAP